MADDTYIFDIKGNLTPLERDIATAERKLADSKRKVESIGWKLKVDTSQVDRAIDALVKKINAIASRPIKLQLDTSDAERKLSALQGRMGGSATGAAFGGAAVGFGNRFGNGVVSGASSVVGSNIGSVASNAASWSLFGNNRGFHAQQSVNASPNFIGVTSVGGQTCGRCGAVNPAGIDWCRRCGARLSNTLLGNIARMGGRAAGAVGGQALHTAGRILTGNFMAPSPPSIEEMLGGIATTATGIQDHLQAIRSGGISGHFSLPAATSDALESLGTSGATMITNQRRQIRQFGRMRRAMSMMAEDASVRAKATVYNTSGILGQTTDIADMLRGGGGRRRRGGGGSGIGKTEPIVAAAARGDIDLSLIQFGVKEAAAIGSSMVGVSSPFGGDPTIGFRGPRGSIDIPMVRLRGSGNLGGNRELGGGPAQEADLLGAFEHAGTSSPIMDMGNRASTFNRMGSSPLFSSWMNNLLGTRNGGGGMYGGTRPPGVLGPLMSNGGFYTTAVQRGMNWLGQPLSGGPGLNALGAMGITRGMGMAGMGVFAGLSAVSAGADIQRSLAQSYAYHRGMEIDPTFGNVNGAEMYGHGRSGIQRALPFLNSVGEDIWSLFGGGEAGMTKDMANERAAEQRRDIRFQAHRRSAFGRSAARNIGSQMKAMTFDRYKAMAGEANANFDAVVEDIAMNGNEYGPEKANAMMSQATLAKSMAMRELRGTKRADRLQFGRTSSALSGSIFDELGSANASMRGQYGGLNGTESLDPTTRRRAKSLVKLELRKISDAFVAATGDLVRENSSASMDLSGNSYGASLQRIENSRLTAVRPYSGSRDFLSASRITAINENARIQTSAARLQFNVAQVGMEGTNRAGQLHVAGNSLGAQLAGIDAERQQFVMSQNGFGAFAPGSAQSRNFNNTMAGFAVRDQVAQKEFQLGRISVSMGTRSINSSTAQQRYLNSNSPIAASVRGIIDDTSSAIMQTNIDMAGSGMDKERMARIGALRENAMTRLSGISEQLRFHNHGEVVGAYQSRGDATNNAYKDFGAAEALAASAAKSFDDASNGTTPSTNANGPTNQQAQDMINWLQKIAENIGII